MSTKKQQQAFNNQVVGELVSLGATRTTYDHPVTYREYKLHTKAGELKVIVPDPTAGKVFSIFCIFDSPEEAYTIVPNTHRLNIHSGKYNFHETEADECLNVFKWELNQML